jgi:class 3 adenylate cyclase
MRPNRLSDSRYFLGPLERKLIAILAADVQGYSRLMGIDKEDTLATLSAHRAVTDAIIAQHGQDLRHGR